MLILSEQVNPKHDRNRIMTGMRTDSKKKKLNYNKRKRMMKCAINSVKKTSTNKYILKG